MWLGPMMRGSISRPVRAALLGPLGPLMRAALLGLVVNPMIRASLLGHGGYALC